MYNMTKGSLKIGLNKIKPISRTKNEKWWDKEKKKLNVNHNTYSEYCKEKLEKIFKNEIKYTCECCLQTSYESLCEGNNGYVTDEELIKSSNNLLKHK